MTKAELDRAYLAGVSARQVGRTLKANPYTYRTGRDGDLLRSAWADGHASARRPETTNAD